MLITIRDPNNVTVLISFVSGLNELLMSLSKLRQNVFNNYYERTSNQELPTEKQDNRKSLFHISLEVVY